MVLYFSFLLLVDALLVLDVGGREDEGLCGTALALLKERQAPSFMQEEVTYRTKHE